MRLKFLALVGTLRSQDQQPLIEDQLIKFASYLIGGSWSLIEPRIHRRIGEMLARNPPPVVPNQGESEALGIVAKSVSELPGNWKRAWAYVDMLNAPVRIPKSQSQRLDLATFNQLMAFPYELDGPGNQFKHARQVNWVAHEYRRAGRKRNWRTECLFSRKRTVIAGIIVEHPDWLSVEIQPPLISARSPDGSILHLPVSELDDQVLAALYANTKAAR